MRPDQLIDLAQTVVLVSALAYVTYAFARFRRDAKVNGEALQKIMDNQHRLEERLTGIEAAHGIHDDVAALTTIRRFAEALRSAMEANNNTPHA